MKQYTVTEITKAIKQLLESQFGGLVSVTGEVSSLSRSPAGHYYFVLKDPKAQIKVVYFKGYAGAPGAFVPKNGDSVQVAGELSVYEQDGSYQLVAKRVMYDSVGLFWQKFEESRRKLEAEGLFDADRKRELPRYPARIALLTSPEGAALKDFVVTARKGGGRFLVDLWPVPVQGMDAVPKLVQALSCAGSMTDRYDVLVLMRGGGSLEDLAVFNDEAVARALHGCEVPTISAIGHERDVSICDFVADVREATPTAAATRLSAPFQESIAKLSTLTHRMASLMERRLARQMQRLDSVTYRMLASSPSARIKDSRQKIAGMQDRIASRIQNAIQKQENRLMRAEQSIVSYPFAVMIGRQGDKIASAEMRMRSALDRTLRDTESKYTLLIEKLNTLSPFDVLRRGYAIITKEGKPVSSVRDVHVEEELAIRFKDGYASSFVTGRKLEEDPDNG